MRFAYMPANPIVVIKQSIGFPTGQEALNTLEDVVIEIEVAASGGISERFRLGRTFSSNAGIYWSTRKDNTWDFGSRLVIGQLTNGAVAVRIHDDRNVLRYPLVIEFQKLNEMPF